MDLFRSVDRRPELLLLVKKAEKGGTDKRIRVCVTLNRSIAELLLNLPNVPGIVRRTLLRREMTQGQLGWSILYSTRSMWFCCVSVCG
jgi:hypothetical protein